MRTRALWSYRVEDTEHANLPFFDKKWHGRPRCYVIQVTYMGITYDYDWTTEIEHARKKVAVLNR